MPRHRFAAVVDGGEVPVVGATEGRNVGRRVVAAQAEGVSVMELEPDASPAPLPLIVDIAAASLVPLVHRPPDRRRHVAR